MFINGGVFILWFREDKILYLYYVEIECRRWVTNFKNVIKNVIPTKASSPHFCGARDGIKLDVSDIYIAYYLNGFLWFICYFKHTHQDIFT